MHDLFTILQIDPIFNLFKDMVLYTHGIIVR